MAAVRNLLLLLQVLQLCLVPEVLSHTDASHEVQRSIDSTSEFHFEIASIIAKLSPDQALRTIHAKVSRNSKLSSDQIGSVLLDFGLMLLFGNTTSISPQLEMNETFAMGIFNESAALGNPKAQFILGVGYSTGLWGMQRNDAISLLYYYFASMNDDVGALMALGNRHANGIGVPKQCETAILYYEKAAEISMEERDSQKVTPILLDSRPSRLKTNIDGGNKSPIIDDELIEYYQYSAQKGDTDALVSLGLHYYYGARGVKQDLQQAAEYFQKAVDLGSTSATASLGHMYTHGLGVEKDEQKAFRLFQEAAHEANAAGQNGLAYLHLHGMGTPVDLEKAIKLFESAGKQGNAEALYNLGSIYMRKHGDRNPDFNEALHHFYLAAQYSHTRSIHNLAKMNMHGIGTRKNCLAAMGYFKLVAERGPWIGEMKDAFQNFVDTGRPRTSFNIYVLMAEQGYEIAQHNAAYFIEHERIGEVLNLTSEGELAVRFYKQSANQGFIDAHLKIGDFYYYGFGGLDVDYERAIAHYRQAGRKQNAQAMFNLGIMYEHGLGLPQDFYLAKRWYDLALSASTAAKFPVKLALLKLQIHIAVVKFRAMIKSQGIFNSLYRMTKMYMIEIMKNVELVLHDNVARFTSSWNRWTENGSTKIEVASKKSVDPEKPQEKIPDGFQENIKNNDVEFESTMLEEYVLENHILLVLLLLLGIVMYFITQPDQRRRRQRPAPGPAPAPAQH